ncbi:C40 family peptidase [Qiania dongpingensis]|uniref:C40 family peptidase n=1 Tax=Qiania dongpingensis TaxID=2763669 RepID=A0A7G9G679_9FIRM|nr:SH3 domain-containing C40 family peptidase [Qiania dongpingensis]QNM06311.1 C40 family peptidase [Qiania dongpingensis]
MRKRTGFAMILLAALLVGAALPARAETGYCAAFDKFLVSAGECVNVRTEPKMDAEIIAEVYPGQILECNQVTEGEAENESGTKLWCQISLPEGTAGYVKYDYFLHGDALQEYLMATGRVYADIGQDTRAAVYATTEMRYGQEQEGPTGSLWNVASVWDGLLELDGLGFVRGEDCRLTVVTEEEKAAREAAGLAEDAPDFMTQLAEQNEIDRMEHPELFSLWSAVTPETTGLRAAVVAKAQSHAGLSYVWGGTDLGSGVDCSGLTMSVYAEFGVSIGRTTRQQAAGGREVAAADMQPGDLAFYADENGMIYHVVMYVGGGMCVHARDEAHGVVIEPIPGNYCKVVSYI